MRNRRWRTAPTISVTPSCPALSRARRRAPAIPSFPVRRLLFGQTAEDLPVCRFAGQAGEPNLQCPWRGGVAVDLRRCYARLFTDRAITLPQESRASTNKPRLALSIGRAAEWCVPTWRLRCDVLASHWIGFRQGCADHAALGLWVRTSCRCCTPDGIRSVQAAADKPGLKPLVEKNLRRQRRSRWIYAGAVGRREQERADLESLNAVAYVLSE